MLPAALRPAKRDLAEHPIQRGNAAEVLRKFREILRATNSRVAKMDTRRNVTGAQLWALCEIQAHPGINVTALTSAMALHQSTVSNLLDKLLGKHLVRRRRDSGDARVAHFYVTAAGERAINSAGDMKRGVLLETLEHFSPKALRQLDGELENVLRRMRAHAHENDG